MKGTGSCYNCARLALLVRRLSDLLFRYRQLRGMSFKIHDGTKQGYDTVAYHLS